MPPETLVNYGYDNVFLTFQMILMAAVQPCAYGLLCEQEHNQECVQPESASFRFFSYAQTYLMHRECFFS